MKYKVLLPLLLLLVNSTGQAQTVQDYFFKSWDLSYVTPAAVAYDTSMVGNLTYSQDMVGGVQTNVGGQLQLHTNVGTGHGVGINIQSSRSGILSGNSVGANYAYRIRLSENQSLSAGVKFIYFKNSLNRASVEHSNVDDPMLYGDLFQQNSILVSTGFLYEWKQLRLAINAPETLPLEGTRYARRNYSMYMGYSFVKNDWQVRPNFYFENLEALGNWYETGLYASYKDRLAMEVGFTSENALRAKATVAYNSFTVGYGYNAGKTAKEGYENQMGHRLYVGYNFGDVFAKSKRRKAQELEEREQLEMILKEKTQLLDNYKDLLKQTEDKLEQTQKTHTDTLQALLKLRKEPATTVEPPMLDETPSVSASAGYYVAIASFDTMWRVNAFMQQYDTLGLSPKVMYISEIKKYRVYVDSFTRLREALKTRNHMRKAGFRDSWIFEIK
ncbi:type IX secretion system membrane protein PorP/SprF [Pontibacter oryzae]|uniref:Type IX secretion system membrane protein PorP/SprF n=1 Tax=Pontibacter oryzae TaxID=2304593 RepID=A0A399RSH3_9BACT|nr:type IX secretion system membrane protein PorP/SprF [Pontibacter oryzae]RIJ34058.1 type IX secretion system membrane protein PorP/SprF [Pontibacter oryzae]